MMLEVKERNPSTDRDQFRADRRRTLGFLVTTFAVVAGDGLGALFASPHKNRDPLLGEPRTAEGMLLRGGAVQADHLWPIEKFGSLRMNGVSFEGRLDTSRISGRNDQTHLMEVIGGQLQVLRRDLQQISVSGTRGPEGKLPSDSIIPRRVAERSLGQLGEVEKRLGNRAYRKSFSLSANDPKLEVMKENLATVVAFTGIEAPTHSGNFGATEKFEFSSPYAKSFLELITRACSIMQNSDYPDVVVWKTTRSEIDDDSLRIAFHLPNVGFRGELIVDGLKLNEKGLSRIRGAFQRAVAKFSDAVGDQLKP